MSAPNTGWKAVEARHPDAAVAKYGTVGYRIIDNAEVVQAECFSAPFSTP